MFDMIYILLFCTLLIKNVLQSKLCRENCELMKILILIIFPNVKYIYIIIIYNI